MPQCPVCKKPSRELGSSCRHCGVDLSALRVVRELPTSLHNDGLAALESGDDIEALVNLAAASRLTDDPRPRAVLDGLLARHRA